MSVRFSQLLVAIVLALLAYALFRTVSAYQETTARADLRVRGEQIAARETQRLGERIASIESLAAVTAVDGYVPARFENDVRRAMKADDAVQAVDFFNASDQHTAHIEAGKPTQRGVPHGAITRLSSHPEMRAIELALFDAELSRATSVTDVPPKRGGTPVSALDFGRVYLATRVVWHERDLGTIVEFLDVRRLIVDDVAQAAAGGYELDDGRGRPLASANVPTSSDTRRESFPIPFADRVLQLSLAAPARVGARRWWFIAGWFALVLAIVIPIEVVGHINRRMQALNEELESRVAARTHQLQESLEESRRLAIVVESVREGVMRVGSDGIIGYVNAALCSEVQMTERELVGHPLASIEVLGLTATLLNDIRNEMSESGFVYREMERLRADGTRYIAGVTFARPGLDGSGSIIAVSRDITARRRLIDELVAANELTARQMRARADFIATASHELRTPVTTLRMLAALLLEKMQPQQPLAPDDERLLSALDEETRRLGRLVDDLLKIARLDAPGASMTMVDVDLRTIVRSSIDDMQRLGSGGPAIATHGFDRAHVVHGDDEALRSVATNLIGNAQKFTPPSGHIDVTLESVGKRVRFIVADTGMGISKADLPHIFERFYRAPQAVARASGAGLGLAIVARLVEIMNGTIQVASESGRGTTVTVEYPLGVTAAAEVAPAPASAAQSGP